MRNPLTYVSALAIAAGMAVPAMAETEGQYGDQQPKTQSEAGSQTAGETQATGTDTTGETRSTDAGATDQTATGTETEQGDRLVATVGDAEIRQSDVLGAIESLPPGVQQTPPQMLLPAVVDQLVMRRLIVDEARAEGLESDAEVQERLNAQSDGAMDQALVEVWLKRELDERVTDADVDAAVDEIRAQNPDMGDAATVAPQVRQTLQVQAMTDIGEELREGAEITFYGPTGDPVDTSEQVGSGSEGESATGAQPQN